MNVIILGAGKGTRMLPWTENNSKLLFKVNGEPLIKHHIKHLKAAGFDNIYLTAYHNAEKIYQVTSTLGITVYDEKTLVDTGTACKYIFDRYKLDRALIVYGDTYFNRNIYGFMADAYNHKCNYILTEHITKEMQDISRSRLTGLVKYNKIAKITNISEKGQFTELKAGETIGKNAGMVLLNRAEIRNGDLMGKVLPKVKNIYAREILGGWVDIGSIDSYIDLTLKLYKNEQVEWARTNTVMKKFTKRILLSDRIFIMGNGGSFTTAQHIALDWSRVGKKHAIALDSAPMITAYANDTGYENAFLSQLDMYKPTPKDIILLISGSGNSPNIRKVIEMYPANMIMGMSGNKGFLKETVPVTLTVPSDNIRKIEDAHLCYGHCITEILEGLRND